MADIWEEGAKQVCDQYGIPKYVKDYKDLIADPEVDAVLICSPTDQHADQIMEASRAGKAIFCEKPISLNLEIIDEVCSVVEQTGKYIYKYIYIVMRETQVFAFLPSFGFYLITYSFTHTHTPL